MFNGRLDRLYGRYESNNLNATLVSDIIVTPKGEFYFDFTERQYNLCIDSTCSIFKEQDKMPIFYDFAATDNSYVLLQPSSISVYDDELNLVHTFNRSSVQDIDAIESLYKDFYYLSAYDKSVYKIKTKNGRWYLDKFITIKESAIKGFEIKSVESFALFYDRVAVLVTTQSDRQKAIIWYDAFGQFIEAKMLDDIHQIQQLQAYQNYLLLVAPDDFKILIMDKSNTMLGLVSWPEIQVRFNNAYEQRLFYERLIPVIMPLTVFIIIFGVFIVYKLRTTQLKLDFNYDKSNVRI